MLTRTTNNYFLDFSVSYKHVQRVLEEYGYSLSNYSTERKIFLEKDEIPIGLDKSDELTYPYLLFLAKDAKLPLHDFFASLCVLKTR